MKTYLFFIALLLSSLSVSAETLPISADWIPVPKVPVVVLVSDTKNVKATALEARNLTIKAIIKECKMADEKLRSGYYKPYVFVSVVYNNSGSTATGAVDPTVCPEIRK